MSMGKHTDKICVIITVLTVLLTVLFMNGRRLGISVLSDGESVTDELFTENDLDDAWDRTGATEILLRGNSAKIRGNGAFVSDGTVHIVYAGRYVLSGDYSGSVVVDADGDDKIWLALIGVDITAKDGAALRIEQAKKVFLTLTENTENTLTDGETGSDETVDGTIYARDDLTVNGKGCLVVNGNRKHGLVCNDDLVLAGGNITVTAKEDGLHANDSIRVCDTDLTVNAGDDGLHAGNDDETAFFYMESGNIKILSCYEGIEAHTVTVAGGTVEITPTDDGLNADGGADALIEITGGEVTVNNPTGRDADGLDSNGDIQISGGTVFVSVAGDSSNTALDYGSENGGQCIITGGRVLAFGGNGMFESVSGNSTQGFLQKTDCSAAAETTVILTDTDGREILNTTVPNTFSAVVISDPALAFGESYTLAIGEESTQITAENTAKIQGGFGGGSFGNNRQQPPMGMQMSDMEDMTPPQPPDEGEMPERTAGEGKMPPFGNENAMPQQLGENTGEPPELPEGDRSERRDGMERNRSEIGNSENRNKNENKKTTASVPIGSVVAVGSSVVILLGGILIAWYKKG